MRRSELIDTLVADLAPAPKRLKTTARAAVWIALTAVYVAVITMLTGPVRPGALAALVNVPQFTIETSAGAAAAILLTMSAFRGGVPGEARHRFTQFAWLSAAIWVLFYVAGFWFPAVEPSMVGKRPFCFLEVVAFSALPMLLGIVLLRRLFTLRPIAAGLTLGAASGMFPALAMQVACMYTPAHILQFHVAPIIASVAVGAILGATLLARSRP